VELASLTDGNLIAILAIIVSVFGLLLTAIGVLVLSRFSDLGDRIDEMRADLRVLWERIDRQQDKDH
jgi:hypothetical protein